MKVSNIAKYGNRLNFYRNIRQVLGEMRFPEKNHRNNGRGYLVIEQCLQ
jgi:hypothetical protein